MYGWRGRVGLILPVDNAVMEPELYSLQLEGISFHSARLSTGDRERMPEDGIGVAPVLRHLAVDVVVYACAATSFLQGIDANSVIAERLETACGVPAITATGAMWSALKAAGVERVAIGTPYAPFRGQLLVDFLTQKGLEVVNAVHDELDLFTTNLQSPEFAYRLGARASRPEVDAILISGTNLRTLEIIRTLEEDTGKLVISTNQAVIWSLAGVLGLDLSHPLLGKLMAVAADTSEAHDG